MSHKKIAQESFEESVQITSIYWLAASNDGDSLPADVWAGIEDGDYEKMFGAALPSHVDDEDEEDVAQHMVLSGMNGLLCHCRTPSPIDAHGTNYRWGMYCTFWVYSESLEDAFEKAVKEGRRLKEKKLDRPERTGFYAEER